ncbi:MAG TPA: COX15/CtaA family protein [Flavitalea sp.]|nr:COX15/CtaA family protein [Flavitalea sp.]
MIRNKGSHAVSLWIAIGLVMLIIQVLLGGITRLTGSGLSITEWKVVTGTLPPLTEDEWNVQFNQYKATPQYNFLNSDFTLADFKFIFFWEWLHRFWARLIGVVFVTGFIFLAIKRYLKKEMVIPLVILFILGGLQGAVGWIMVLSGLTGDAVYVKPLSLMLHFLFALALIVYTFLFFLKLRIPEDMRIASKRARIFLSLIIMLLFIQLAFGALMSGHKAASAAPTWPDINESFFPAAAWKPEGGPRNLVENKLTIHFIHRSTGYILFILILCYSVYALRNLKTTSSIRRGAPIPLILIFIQVSLGIAAVLLSPRIIANGWGQFETVAIMHQAVAILLLLSLVYQFYLVNRKISPDYHN